MSHDFESTEAETTMLSHMKDIEVNRKKTELGDIISGAILDGQNQIHDLYKEKATAQEVEYRMRRSYTYWMNKLQTSLHQELQEARESERERIANNFPEYWLDSECVPFDCDHNNAVRDCYRAINQSELDQATGQTPFKDMARRALEPKNAIDLTIEMPSHDAVFRELSELDQPTAEVHECQSDTMLTSCPPQYKCSKCGRTEKQPFGMLKFYP